MDLKEDHRAYEVDFLHIQEGKSKLAFLQLYDILNLVHMGLADMGRLLELKLKGWLDSINHFCPISNLLQFLKGFPVNPLGQKQMGFPLSFSQRAFIPHGLGLQGSVGAETIFLIYLFNTLKLFSVILSLKIAKSILKVKESK